MVVLLEKSPFDTEHAHHLHHLGLVQESRNQRENFEGYDDCSEGDGRRLEGAAIELFNLDHCQITLSETVIEGVIVLLVVHSFSTCCSSSVSYLLYYLLKDL